MNGKNRFTILLILLFVFSILFGLGIGLLLVNINTRKLENMNKFIRVVEVDENTIDPEIWGQNWPFEYDLYKKSALRTSTKYGGHGGSESLPREKSEIFPFLPKMYAGYAFALDYRERRGHAYMLFDQEQTKRLTVPQSASCLHCHSSVLPLYKKLGDGNIFNGFMKSYKLSYQEGNMLLKELKSNFPVSCIDCHDPKTMALRVTRPAFLQGIADLAASDYPLSHFPSIEIWRNGARKEPYDPNREATRNEMRTFVCAQCHVEYYCGTKMPLIFPWKKGLSVDNIEKFYDEIKFPDKEDFYDFKHKITKAKIFKAQHPEFEMANTGIHLKSGVACADCHMPYIRVGASKISDHWVRSPLLNVNRACQVCHSISEEEIKKRVETIQDSTFEIINKAGKALNELIDEIELSYNEGYSEKELEEVLKLQKRAQWYLDFVSSENSMGFHSPQETAKILANSIEFIREAQVKLAKIKETKLYKK